MMKVLAILQPTANQDSNLIGNLPLPFRLRQLGNLRASFIPY